MAYPTCDPNCQRTRLEPTGWTAYVADPGGGRGLVAVHIGETGYCPFCGYRLHADGTTTPPATPEQRKDAEAMAALRRHNISIVRPLSHGEPDHVPISLGTPGEPLRDMWEASLIGEWYEGWTSFEKTGGHAPDPAAAILLAAERLEKEGETPCPGAM